MLVVLLSFPYRFDFLLNFAVEIEAFWPFGYISQGLQHIWQVYV